VPGAQLVTLSNGARFGGKLVSFEDFLLSGGSLSLGGPSSRRALAHCGTLQGRQHHRGPARSTGRAARSRAAGSSSPRHFVATLAPTGTSLQLGRNWQNRASSLAGGEWRDLVIADGASLVNALGGVVTLAAAQAATSRADGSFRNDAP